MTGVRVDRGNLGYSGDDDLVLMSEMIEVFRNKIRKWKEGVERKCLKDNLGKTNVVVSGDIAKDGMSKSKVADSK